MTGRTLFASFFVCLLAFLLSLLFILQICLVPYTSCRPFFVSFAQSSLPLLRCLQPLLLGRQLDTCVPLGSAPFGSRARFQELKSKVGTSMAGAIREFVGKEDYDINDVATKVEDPMHMSDLTSAKQELAYLATFDSLFPCAKCPNQSPIWPLGAC